MRKFKDIFNPDLLDFLILGFVAGLGFWLAMAIVHTLGELTVAFFHLLSRM